MRDRLAELWQGARAVQADVVTALKDRRYGHAVALGRRALGKAPANVDALASYGMALVMNAQLDEARYAAEKLDQLDPRVAAGLWRWIAQPPEPEWAAMFGLERRYPGAIEADAALVAAVRAGDANAAAQALDAGASPEAVEDITGFTVLLVAAGNGHTAIVEQLLERGASASRTVPLYVQGRIRQVGARTAADVGGMRGITALLDRAS